MVIVCQFVAIPLSLLAGLLSMFAAVPLFSFVAPSPLPFHGIASAFVLWAPIVHTVLAVGLLIERARAWQRALVLGWVVLVGESVFLLGTAVSLGWEVGLWLTPLLMLDVVTVVYGRDPRVEMHLLAAG